MVVKPRCECLARPLALHDSGGTQCWLEWPWGEQHGVRGSEMTTELATGAAEAWAWACERKALAGAIRPGSLMPAVRAQRS